MKTRWIVCALAALIADASAAGGWLESYPEALALAAKNNRPVLIDFMGSDWCVPCIQMKKTVFDSEAFQKYADDHLVLLEVDFPQGRKQPKKQFEENQALGEKFGAIDPMGMLRVPTVTLVSPQGEVLATQHGAFFKPEEVIAWIEAAEKKTPAAASAR